MEFEKIWSATAESEAIAVVRLDPRRVRLWKGNARLYDRLTEANTRDLIDSIDAVGQQYPAIVRPVAGDADHYYELIAGSRRHWAVSWLRAHDRDVRLLAQVVNLTDEAAFNLSDAENRAREDVSDLERARNYAWALKTIYKGSLGAMADKMKISKSWLSKMISVSRIPDEVIAAFSSPFDIKVKPAYALAQELADEERASEIRRTAKRLARRQTEMRARGEQPFSAKETYELLLAHEPKPKPVLASWRCASGQVALTLKERTFAGLLIRVHADTGADPEELVAAFRESLAYLKPRQ